MSDDEGPPAGAAVGSSDADLPKAPINKLITDTLQNGVTATKDVKDLIADCAKEFITLIASEANELAEKSSKKTINPEHVTQSLKDLGFEAYVAECDEVVASNSEAVKYDRQRKSKAEKASGMTEEEAAAAQEALFAAARAKYAAGEA